MNEEIRYAIQRYFSAEQLVSLLDLTVEEILEAFEDAVEENLDDILEEMDF
jgi:hypothetical protein